MTHELKTWPEYYDFVADGSKTFEVRKLDRPFCIGDTLVLKEWSPVKWKDSGGYSGREVERQITYVMTGGSWGINEETCILGIIPPYQETLSLRAENERLRGLLEDRVRSHAYGVVCRRIDVVMNGGPTDELLQKECDKAWNFYKTENNL